MFWPPASKLKKKMISNLRQQKRKQQIYKKTFCTETILKLKVNIATTEHNKDDFSKLCHRPKNWLLGGPTPDECDRHNQIFELVQQCKQVINNASRRPNFNLLLIIAKLHSSEVLPKEFADKRGHHWDQLVCMQWVYLKKKNRSSLSHVSKV